MLSNLYLSLIFILTNICYLALCSCECGFSIGSKDRRDHDLIFTESLESDFTILDRISSDREWQPQHWAEPPVKSKGPYGRVMNIQNVIANQGNSNDSNAGLQLWALAKPILKKGTNDEYLSGSEIGSIRSVRYGSFRAGIRAPRVTGTCASWFYFHSDTSEIDVELLNRGKKNESVNFVMHSDLDSNGDSSETPNYVKLPLRTYEKVLEYRFDWSPEKVSFYIDGKHITDMVHSVPWKPGRLILSHWSNGNPYWSGQIKANGGNAEMLVQYIRAYFNTTETKYNQAYGKRCQAALSKSRNDTICEIPEDVGRNFIGPTLNGRKTSRGERAAKSGSFTVICMLVTVIMLAGVIF